MPGRSEDFMGNNNSKPGNGKVLLSCNDLWKIYKKERQDVPVCCNLNFDIYENEFLCITGPTGSGKSTILKMIAGLEMPSMGSLTLKGKPINGPGLDRGMIFQEYSMLPWRTVYENILLGMEFQKESKKTAREMAMKYVNMVGLGYAKDKYPWELSGGMKRRTTLAMVLVTNPKILLMDSAFNALDAKTKMTMQMEIVDIWKKENCTIVFVTSELDEATKLGDRIIVLNSRGEVSKIVKNDLPRPRHGKAAQDSKFLRRFVELREELFSILKAGTFKNEVH
tara:strand:+ start:20981 stop:21823 length:843 start_codon:yes stop_codon:yes gene_type:complete